MKASDVMTQPVITIQHDASLSDAVQLMLRNRVSGIPVVNDDGKLVGMISEGDLLRRCETDTERRHPRWLAFLFGPARLADEYVHSHSRRVREIMSTKMISVAPDTPLSEVVSIMERHRIRRVPVMRDERLIGIVTRANLMQALLHFSSTLPSPLPSDSDIQQRITDEFKAASWVDKGYISVVVKEGNVHLYGIVTDERERDALRVAAENVPGVKAVFNHVEWCDLASGTVLSFPEEQVTPPTSST